MSYRSDSRRSLPSRRLLATLLALLALAALPAPARAQEDARALRVGHWVRIKGTLDERGVFRGETVEVREPEEDEELIGSVPADEDGRTRFLLLGQEVHVSAKTEWHGMQPSPLNDVRVKVQGRYRGPRNFSAREIERRTPGRDRIEGRIDRIARAGGELELYVMRFRVLVPADLVLENEEPVADFELAEERVGIVPTSGVDDDDDLRDSLTLGPFAVGGLIELRSDLEDEYDLDGTTDRNRLDTELSARVRATYESDGFTGQAELRYRARWREDDQDGSSSDGEARIGETFGYWRDVAGSGWDVQVGRQDFDDPREWVYDQNLDGVRFVRPGARLLVELSATTTLDGGTFDEAAENLIAYVSNNDSRRHLAAYAVHREVDLASDPERVTHLGVRAIGDWLPDQESWVELAHVTGSIGPDDLSGWGVDVGTVWRPDDGPWSFALGLAAGTGDNEPGDGRDRAFRQTGFQDNTAKLGGVTSIRYYGELVDPELSNLAVLTAGVTRELDPNTTLSLLAHHYEQMKAAPFLLDTNLDALPNGLEPDLGWEIDVVLGSRRWKKWNLEVVAGTFNPGDGFDQDEHAYFGKFQLRYRF